MDRRIKVEEKVNHTNVWNYGESDVQRFYKDRWKKTNKHPAHFTFIEKRSSSLL